jgi:hypothetical protein
MARRRSKHNAPAQSDPYEGWTHAQLVAELARYGYRWAPPPEPMTVGGRPVMRILDGDSFRVLAYLGPMLYWHYRVEREGVVVTAQLVRGSSDVAMSAASRAALHEVDRTIELAADALRD